jgi:hypothetical protein
MYVSVGSSCNVCFEEDERRAALLRFRPDGSEAEIFASGLRNSVGFDWKPDTGELFATDNGRDLLGDDFPPCELNRVVRGGFYGWPLANGDRVVDPDLGVGRESEVEASIPPVHGFRAHTAPLGITFLQGDSAPAPYRGAALVALHGSWNRHEKDGYEVVSLHWHPDGSVEERPFLSGFLEDGDVIGRPVDVAEGPDGAIYVSDDYAGSIYRIGWGEPSRAAGDRPRVDPSERPEPLARLTVAERASGSARGAALYELHACAGRRRTEGARGARRALRPRVPLRPAGDAHTADARRPALGHRAPGPRHPSAQRAPLESEPRLRVERRKRRRRAQRGGAERSCGAAEPSARSRPHNLRT